MLWCYMLCINNQHCIYVLCSLSLIVCEYARNSIVEVTCVSATVFSTLNGAARINTKENRQLRRQSSNESDDSEKKRLKTVR